MHAKTVEQILVAMDSTGKREDDLAAYQRRMLQYRLIWTIVALLGYAGILTYATASLWQACHTGAWSPFWDAVRYLWVAFAFLGIGSVFSEQAQQAGQAHVLRERLTMQAQQPELPEAYRPDLLASSDLFAGSERFGPFERLERWRTSNMISALILLALFSAGFLLTLIVVLLFAHLPTPADVTFCTLVLGLPGAGLAWLTVHITQRLRRMRSPFWVASGEWGLEWERVAGAGRRRHARLPWNEVRAFFVITEPDVSNDAYSISVVQGSSIRLTWVMPRAPLPDQRAANDALRRVITARTGLPLTEVSAATLSPEDYGGTAPGPTPAAPRESPRVARFLTCVARSARAHAPALGFWAAPAAHLKLNLRPFPSPSASSTCSVMGRIDRILGLFGLLDVWARPCATDMPVTAPWLLHIEHCMKGG